MEYNKQKRIQDPLLLGRIRRERCCICGKLPPSDCCHVKTRGSGGDDIEDNVFPACRKCHINQGAIGFKKMFALYPVFRKILSDKGWQLGERGLERSRPFNK